MKKRKKAIKTNKKANAVNEEEKNNHEKKQS
jgi:hypothetical protein